MSPAIALATCSELPVLAEDDPLLLDALRARGVLAEPAVWDDPDVDWSAFDLVILRSTWDYSGRREQFLAWTRSVPRLLNPPDVVAWNTDKRYLGDLPGTVPTIFLQAPATAWDPPGEEYVVKPAVSAGSRDTTRYRAGEEAQARAHADALLAAGRTVMVQPYLSSVDAHGETALVFLDGEYSHAIRKAQMLFPGGAPPPGRAAGTDAELFVAEEITARVPAADERAAAEEILDALPWPREDLLYARVDLIRDAGGAPLLIELELTEPSLFLSHGLGAADRLAASAVERL
jgi:glutathione synthase/RimK-type ligase-like ATP-grasp enzyme